MPQTLGSQNYQRIQHNPSNREEWIISLVEHVYVSSVEGEEKNAHDSQDVDEVRDAGTESEVAEFRLPRNWHSLQE